MKYKLYIILFTCMFWVLLPSKLYAIKAISGSIGHFEASNHGIREFIDPTLELNAILDIGGNDYFNLQLGVHHWKNSKDFANQSYTLSSYYIPIRFAYNFHPSEKWKPFFGFGAGLHMLSETYERTEKHSTISLTSFCGVRYMLNKTLFMTGEINYLIGNFDGFDHLNFEGIALRTGIGYSFKATKTDPK